MLTLRPYGEGGTSIPEEEIKRAVAAAFNLLPGHRDELLRMQGALRNGEVKQLDQNIDGLAEQIKRLEERVKLLTVDSGDSEDSEKEFLTGEINQLEDQRNKLILERAEVANKELQVRMLLEILPSAVGNDSTSDGEESDPACSDYEDFFRRTRPVAPPDHYFHYSDELFIRFVDKVTVVERGYEISFKAGITIGVERR